MRCTTSTAAVLATAALALAGPGDLDTGFDGDGRTTTEIFGGTSQAEALVVQPDGKLLVAGTVGGSFALARYLSTGALDPDFGDAGVVATFFGPVAEARGLVREPGGGIVVAGNFPTQFVLARYDADGAFVASVAQRFTSLVVPFDMVRQDDGKFVVSTLVPNAEGKIVLALARYDDQLRPDAQFGTDGFAYLPFRGTASGADLVAVPGGKFVVVAERRAGEQGGSQFALARVTSTGALDPGFGEDGVAVAPLPVASTIRGVVRLSDGNLVAVGDTLGPNLNAVVVAVRFSGDGVFDTNFGTNGVAISDFVTAHAFGDDVVEQADGKLVVVGQTFDSSRYVDTIVTRFTRNGALDPTFGTCGRVVTHFESDFTGRSRGAVAALDGSGRLVVAGQAEVRPVQDFAVLRYDLSGANATSGCSTPGDMQPMLDDLGDLLPPLDDSLSRKERRTAKTLRKLLTKTGKDLQKAATTTGRKQRKAFEKSRKDLTKLLAAARKADRKGTLGEPLQPIEDGVALLLSLLPS